MKNHNRNDILHTKYTIKEIIAELAKTQPKLIAGEGITITDENVISATGGGGGGGNANLEYHDTQYYYDHRTTAYPQGTIIVYSDYKLDVESGAYIPGIKIADGITQVQNLLFINQESEEVVEEVEELSQNVENISQDVETLSSSVETLSDTIEEKAPTWDNKLNFEDEIVDETLVFNRN